MLADEYPLTTEIEKRPSSPKTPKRRIVPVLAKGLQPVDRLLIFGIRFGLILLSQPQQAALLDLIGKRDGQPAA
jgi:hypothetical protein